MTTRDEILRRARVALEPVVPIEEARLDENPDAAFSPAAVVSCRYAPEGMGGGTPKFGCELPGGKVVKVKYGLGNPEIYTEVAATRLLSALGFPADRVYVVKGVKCWGCPADPFPVFRCFQKGGTREKCAPNIDDTVATDFEDAVIEVPLEGRRIETAKESGWRWRELPQIDPARGGATLAEVDALRLMGVFLAHWDNKPSNHRLVCLDAGAKKPSGSGDAAGRCDQPVAMIQDLGATFGPSKIDLRGWAGAPIWADAATCLVSMRTVASGGLRFPDVRISEDGRAWLASRLGKLSDRQIHQLFEGARFARNPQLDNPDARQIENWVRVFQDKRRAITDRPPCPASP